VEQKKKKKGHGKGVNHGSESKSSLPRWVSQDCAYSRLEKRTKENFETKTGTEAVGKKRKQSISFVGDDPLKSEFLNKSSWL